MKQKFWRFACLALAVGSGGWMAWYGAVMLLAKGMLAKGMASVALTESEAASIGIIGGADGPTAIFVTTSGPDWDLVLVGAVFVLSLVGYFLLKRRKAKN